MAVTIQLRRDSAANWTSENPILAEGELGFETDTKLYKIGDGVSSWATLTYASLDVTHDVVALNSVTDPTPPSSGLLLYTKEVAGQMVPKVVGPSGLDVILQPFFGGNGIQMAAPGTSTAMSYFGMGAFTAVGSVSHPVISASSFAESIRRTRVTSAATANSASELRLSVAPAMRGNASNIGGFRAVFRFSFGSFVATQRTAVGLWASTGATSTSAEPSSIVNGVWVGRDSTDSNLQLMYNDASGIASKIDLGVNFSPTDINSLYELVLFCKKGGNEIEYRVMDYTTGNSTQGLVDTDLPVATTPITPHFYINNGGTASSVILDIYRYYLESDF